MLSEALSRNQVGSVHGGGRGGSGVMSDKGWWIRRVGFKVNIQGPSFFAARTIDFGEESSDLGCLL